MSSLDPALAEAARRLAADAFDHAWDLLEREDRTAAEDDELLAATFTQRHLWWQVGDARNRSVADWQVARVAAVLGLEGLARRAAERARAEAQTGALGPFYLGYAYEALARAALVHGDDGAAHEALDTARELMGRVADEDERALLAGDLDELAARLG